MSDWYAKKLAALQGQQPAPQQPPPVQPAQYPPTAPPGQLPAHLAPYAYQQQPQAPQQPHPMAPQGQQGAAPGQVPRLFMSYNAETGAMVADDGHVAALYGAGAQGNSQVVQANSTTCPNCNGGNYFTVQEGGVFSKATMSSVNVMQCSDCGFPNVQAGSQGGALSSASARGGGPAKQARQLRPDHRVSVVVEGGRTATFEPPTSRR